MMSIWWLATLLALACVSASGRCERPGSAWPADLVSYATGRPLTAEQADERKCKSSDGSSIVDVTKSVIYRDSAGRMRIETSQPGDLERSLVFLLDPATGVKIILSTKDKIAHRIAGPKAGRDGFAYGAGGMGEALPSGNWIAVEKALGRRTIDGTEAEGRRTTQTDRDHPSLVASHERWYSDELKLSLLAVSSGPDWTHLARLNILDRKEPDPALFSIPQGYSVFDMESLRRHEP